MPPHHVFEEELFVGGRINSLYSGPLNKVSVAVESKVKLLARMVTFPVGFVEYYVISSSDSIDPCAHGCRLLAVALQISVFCKAFAELIFWRDCIFLSDNQGQLRVLHIRLFILPSHGEALVHLEQSEEGARGMPCRSDLDDAPITTILIHVGAEDALVKMAVGVANCNRLKIFHHISKRHPKRGWSSHPGYLTNLLLRVLRPKVAIWVPVPGPLLSS